VILCFMQTISPASKSVRARTQNIRQYNLHRHETAKSRRCKLIKSGQMPNGTEPGERNLGTAR
jgi:hypothetical protein